MTEFLIPVAPGTPSDSPVGVEQEVRYDLIGPDGTRATFNDPDERDFVGYLTAHPSGLDSPEVRQNSADLVEGDGAIVGDHWLGKRPVTLEGIVMPDTATVVARRIDALRAASRALRADATLRWTPSAGVPVQVAGRAGGPLRITDRRPKKFQLSLTCPDPRIYSQQLYLGQVDSEGTPVGGFTSPLTSPLSASPGVAGSVTCNNGGVIATPPLITVYGPGTNPRIQNYTTGEEIRLIYTLAAGEFLAVDVATHTVYLNARTSRYSAFDFTNSTWWDLEPGDNDIRLSWSSFSTGASLVVQWRYAW